MKKSIVTLIHLGYWTCYALLLVTIVIAGTMGFSQGPQSNYLAKLFSGLALVPAIFSFYVHYQLLFPKFGTDQKKYRIVALMALISVVGGLLGSITLSIIFGGGFLFRGGASAFFGSWLTMSLIALVNGVLGVVVRGFIAWYQELKSKEALQLKNHEMELALVKAQLDPHFLFNTINNIDVLIHKSAESASSYLNQLSDILRFMLFEAKTDTIQLETEVDYIRKYIELQKIRTSNPDYVNFESTGSIDQLKIAPMLFIPFIENAFKHCQNKKAHHAINIELNADNDQIIFECKNQMGDTPSPLSKNNGLGNELIRKRLALLYPNKHRLATSSLNGVYQVRLILYSNEN